MKHACRVAAFAPARRIVIAAWKFARLSMAARCGQKNLLIAMKKCAGY